MEDNNLNNNVASRRIDIANNIVVSIVLGIISIPSWFILVMMTTALANVDEVLFGQAITITLPTLLLLSFNVAINSSTWGRYSNIKRKLVFISLGIAFLCIIIIASLFATRGLRPASTMWM